MCIWSMLKCSFLFYAVCDQERGLTNLNVYSAHSSCRLQQHTNTTAAAAAAASAAAGPWLKWL
jgi:hypothetical protein